MNNIAEGKSSDVFVSECVLVQPTKHFTINNLLGITFFNGQPVFGLTEEQKKEGTEENEEDGC